MSELIDSLKIKGFRGFSELTVSDFGKVNLITGRNNAGKSSLLEAIRIFVNRGSLETIQAILNYREETNELNDPERDVLGNDFGPYRSLFTGLPELISESANFSIAVTGLFFPTGGSEFSVTAAWAIRRVNPEKGSVGYERTAPDLFGDLDGMPALEMRVGERSRVVPLYTPRGMPRRIPAMTPFGDISSEQIRSIYLGPFSSRTTGQLGALWDAIALTDAQDEVVKALKLISPDIEAVSMIGSGEYRLRARTAIVRSKQFDAPVPLRTFGDGVNRLFGIILSLCNAKNGVLLIDEFENGLHYSVQASIWKTIFRLACDLNIQVFATSHSQDCVRAFQEAATGSHQDGVLIRLTRKGDKVLSTTFKERELEIATQNEIEVR
jgi:hypothetical protein